MFLFITSMFLNSSIILNNVNTLRSMHGVMPVVWNNTLANYSQYWSSYLAKNKILQHSNAPYGENIAQISGTSNTLILNAIKLWYAENKNYNYTYNYFNSSTGHFTQLVWKSTTSIGASIAFSSKNIAYIVMEFHPPGNYQTRFIQNVFPPNLHFD